MEEETPEIAVVVPTRGRETRLAFCLEALAAQTLEPSRFEVVVVRDEDARSPFAEAPGGLAVRFLTRSGMAGPTAKRNHGWRSTAAFLVAFTDDDCRPDPGWLEALLAAGAGPSAFLQGRTEVDPDERDLLPWLARSQEIASPTGWYETCNMAYPRALLERLGGFDEGFVFGGEDTDLAYRALDSGAEPAFVEQALVRHAVISYTVADALRAASRWNDLPAVLARHPAVRDALHHRVFWHPSHERLLLALLGLVLGRRLRSRALALLGLAPYLDMRTNWRQPRMPRFAVQIAILPLWALTDAVETLARLPSAIRRRVLVV